MIKAGLFDNFPPEIWRLDCNVNCPAVGQSHAAIKYLAPYVFKVAISNSRIVKVENRIVYFRYRKNHSNRWRTMALDAMEFIRRFLQHVLCTGFMKIRHFGFLNSSCKVKLDTISGLIELSYGFELAAYEQESEPHQTVTCSHCGGCLKLRMVFLASRVILGPG